MWTTKYEELQSLDEFAVCLSREEAFSTAHNIADVYIRMASIINVIV